MEEEEEEEEEVGLSCPLLTCYSSGQLTRHAISPRLATRTLENDCTHTHICTQNRGARLVEIFTLYTVSAHSTTTMLVMYLRSLAIRLLYYITTTLRQRKSATQGP